MEQSTRDLILKSVKTDLGMSQTSIFDARLMDKIQQAEEELTAQGIALTESQRDQELVIMYTDWLWASRRDGAPMPRMLEMARNNRLFGQVAGEAGT